MSDRGTDKGAGSAAPVDRTGAETRQKLIDAAMGLFLTVGYANLRISDITDFAGVGKGTFYLHFQDKRDLLLAYFQRITENVDAMAARAEASHLDFFSGVGLRMKAALNPEANWNNVVTFLRVSASSVDPEVAEAAKDVHARLAKPAKRELTKAIQEGIVRQVDPDLMTFAVVGMTEVLSWRMGLDDRYDVDTVYAFLRDLHLRLLAHGPAESEHCARLFDMLRKAGPAEEAVKAALSLRWPDEDVDTTRLKLIDSAIDLFTKIGYGHLRVSDITENAGVGKGTFYHHFTSKEDVLVAYFHLVKERLEAAEAKIADAGLDHLSRVALRMYFSQEPPWNWNRIVTFIRVQANSSDPEVAQAAREVCRCIAEPSRQDLKEAMRVGLVREMDPELANVALLGMQEILAWRAAQDDLYDPAAMLAFMADVYCRGFLKQ